jgi:hypothetical protein
LLALLGILALLAIVSVLGSPLLSLLKRIVAFVCHQRVPSAVPEVP